MDSVNGMTVFIIMAIVVTALVKVVSLLNDNYNATHNQPTRSRTPPSASTSRPAANPGPLRRTAAVETGPMIYFANDHHGRRDREYRFNYKKVGNSWRAYILRTPSLEGRAPDAAITHKLYDNGKPYVCWNCDVATLKEMQTISKFWADNIQEYIATGKRFG